MRSVPVRFLAVCLAAAGSCVSAAPAVEEGYLQGAEGARLFYQKLGSGPAIIAPGRLFLFDDLRALGDRFTLISYDMRNRGRSDPVADTGKRGIDMDVADLEAVRRHFKVEKPHLVGYSYLGLMVILYAIDHPATTGRIVQLGPVPMKFGAKYPAELAAGGQLHEMGANAEEVKAVQKLAQEGGEKSDPKGFCERLWAVQRYRLVGDPANVDRLGRGWCDMKNEWPVNLWDHFEHSIASVRAVDVTADKLASVRSPVLTIHGRKDRNAAYGAGREWAMKLPEARLVTLPEAAHNALNEYPDVVVPLMREFFGGAWPPGADRVRQAQPAS